MTALLNTASEQACLRSWPETTQKICIICTKWYIVFVNLTARATLGVKHFIFRQLSVLQNQCWQYQDRCLAHPPCSSCNNLPKIPSSAWYPCGCAGCSHMPTHFWVGKQFLSDPCSDLFEEEGKSFQFIVFSHSSNYKTSMTYKWSINWNMGSMSSNIYSVNPYLIK